MSDITQQKYAAWLEEALQMLFISKPKTICIVAITEDDEVITGYYDATPADKAIFAHHIQSDIVMDIIRKNAAKIKDMMEDADDGTDQGREV